MFKELANRRLTQLKNWLNETSDHQSETEAQQLAAALEKGQAGEVKNLLAWKEDIYKLGYQLTHVEWRGTQIDAKNRSKIFYLTFLIEKPGQAPQGSFLRLTQETIDKISGYNAIEINSQLPASFSSNLLGSASPVLFRSATQDMINFLVYEDITIADVLIYLTRPETLFFQRVKPSGFLNGWLNNEAAEK